MQIFPLISQTYHTKTACTKIDIIDSHRIHFERNLDIYIYIYINFINIRYITMNFFDTNLSYRG